jgi:predicted porin
LDCFTAECPPNLILGDLLIASGSGLADETNLTKGVLKMQKKIIALAIAAAFSAPAFADNANINIYGVLDAGYASADKTLTTNAGVATKTGEKAIAYSTMYSSRFGVTGSEDLGDGIKGVVKVETGIGSNQMAGVSQTGTSAIAFNGTTIDATSLGGRELWAALTFAQGTTIKAGFGSSLVRDISLGYDAAPGGNLVGNLLNNDATLGSNRVVGVTLTQDFGVVKASAQVSHNSDTSDGKNDVQKNNGYLLGLQYTDGPASASFAYQNLKNATNAVAQVAGVVPTTTSAGTPFAAAVAATEVTQKISILAGSYDLGVAKLFAEYASIQNDDAITTLAKGTGKRSYESIGVDVPFGTVLGFFQFSHGSMNQVATAGTASNSRSMSGYTLGAKYSLTKRTSGYVSVGNTKLDQGTAAGETGIKVDQFALGLVHSF